MASNMKTSSGSSLKLFNRLTGTTPSVHIAEEDLR